MPDFSGYTVSNYKKDFDENRVDVIELQAADPSQTTPNAPGSYPPNMLKRLRAAGLDPNVYTDQYGLRCYKSIPPIRNEQITCYGQRDAKLHEFILLHAYVPPFAPGVVFPIMQAEYYTSRYGGRRLVWRTHVTNLSRWRDIDRQIWKFIDSWNIAMARGQDAKPSMPPRTL
jgi:hypothetical protein